MRPTAGRVGSRGASAHPGDARREPARRVRVAIGLDRLGGHRLDADLADGPADGRARRAARPHAAARRRCGGRLTRPAAADDQQVEASVGRVDAAGGRRRRPGMSSPQLATSATSALESRTSPSATMWKSAGSSRVSSRSAAPTYAPKRIRRFHSSWAAAMIRASKPIPAATMKCSPVGRRRPGRPNRPARGRSSARTPVADGVQCRRMPRSRERGGQDVARAARDDGQRRARPGQGSGRRRGPCRRHRRPRRAATRPRRAVPRGRPRASPATTPGSTPIPLGQASLQVRPRGGRGGRASCRCEARGLTRPAADGRTVRPWADATRRRDGRDGRAVARSRDIRATLRERRPPRSSTRDPDKLEEPRTHGAPRRPPCRVPSFASVPVGPGAPRPTGTALPQSCPCSVRPWLIPLRRRPQRRAGRKEHHCARQPWAHERSSRSPSQGPSSSPWHPAPPGLPPPLSPRPRPSRSSRSPRQQRRRPWRYGAERASSVRLLRARHLRYKQGRRRQGHRQGQEPLGPGDVPLLQATRASPSRSNPKPGDIVIWGGGTHVGIYIGNGKAISTLTSGVRVHGVHAVRAPFTAYLHTGMWKKHDRAARDALRRSQGARRTRSASASPRRRRHDQPAHAARVSTRKIRRRVRERHQARRPRPRARTRAGRGWLQVKAGSRTGWVAQVADRLIRRPLERTPMARATCPGRRRFRRARPAC